jgi:hypothetical protein
MNSLKILQAETFRKSTGEPTFWQGSALIMENSIQGWGESVFRGSKVMFVLVGDFNGNKGTLTKLHEKNIVKYDIERADCGCWHLTSQDAYGTLWFL